MAAPWWKSLPEFLLARFPFINALSLLMLLAERAQHETQPPMHPNLIYANIGVFLMCGFLMSGKVMRKELSLVCAGQMFFFAFNMYTNTNLHYSQWQRIRMGVRHIGCAGMFILYSHLQDRKWTTHLRRIGEITVGLYLLGITYVLNNSAEDKRAFLSHVVGGDWSRYFYTLIIACAALSFFSGYFLRDMSISVIILLTLATVFVDCDLTFWVDRRGMHYWNQIRIVLDDICLILGFSMLTVRFDNIVKTNTD
ncbi:transmembrane protein 101-like [Ylistrum balloti]|uniref:transmembrane protein 101-like n=1 Tax=Ylistrum balloti TaxID=509963 RepID=UPI002905DE1D|nr:transmembrane protein 101-like [Ylistrum balloti]